VIFKILHGYQVIDTPEKQQAYDLALHALTMKQNNPGSKLWRMRVKQALKRLEELYGVVL
jgi:hypothetical protein